MFAAPGVATSVQIDSGKFGALTREPLADHGRSRICVEFSHERKMSV